MERLDKFLCESGAGTRSQVKVILKSGRVTVDGKPEKDPGKKIDPESRSSAWTENGWAVCAGWC